MNGCGQRVRDLLKVKAILGKPMLRNDWNQALLYHRSNDFLGSIMTEEDARLDFFQSEKDFDMVPKIACCSYNI